jgi:Fe-S-cluster-containing dehydrogenase component
MDLLDRLLQSSLFANAEEDSTRDALAFECAVHAADTDAARNQLFGERPPRPAYLRVLEVDAGARVIRQGDLETDLILVLSGRLLAERAEAGAGTRTLYELGVGTWCGEITTLSHRPAPFSAVAATASEVVTIDARLLRKLYDEDGGVKAAVDAAYCQRALRLHLCASPLLAGLTDAELAGIEQQAKPVTLAEDEVLAAQDAPADTLYLVRSGGIVCEQVSPAGTRVLAYAMANSTFGEHAVCTTGAIWPGRLRALMRTELVALQRAAFDALRARNPRALLATSFAANTDLATAADSPQARDELNLMVGKQSYKGGRALVIDRDKCIRCNLCVESCRDVHDDHIPRLSKIGTRVAAGDVVITACYSCDVPGCMEVCGYGAIRRDRQGLIRFVHDNCVGCAKCITEGCPYGVIRMVEPLQAEAPRKTSVLDWVRELFWLGGKRAAPAAPPMPRKLANPGGEAVEVQGKAIKCDLCAGLPFEACVYNCPTSAIERRHPEELFVR